MAHHVHRPAVPPLAASSAAAPLVCGPSGPAMSRQVTWVIKGVYKLVI